MSTSDIKSIIYLDTIRHEIIGYCFYFGETEEMFIIDESLEDFLTGLDTIDQYEGGWEELPEDRPDK
jgi:hypothetical protein